MTTPPISDEEILELERELKSHGWEAVSAYYAKRLIERLRALEAENARLKDLLHYCQDGMAEWRTEAARKGDEVSALRAGGSDTKCAEIVAVLQREADGWVAENRRLRTAIQTVLDDGESQHPGGWGPDVTMCDVLRKALKGTP